MTFRRLRAALREGPLPIRWNKSNIVEFASITPSGGIEVTNAVTRKTYRLPRSYKDIDVTVLEPDGLVKFGQLFPRGMR